MPAAAVIPAPIAYINVVAVKKLVVGSRFGRAVRLAASTVCPDDFAGSFLVLFTECQEWPARLL